MHLRECRLLTTLVAGVFTLAFGQMAEGILIVDSTADDPQFPQKVQDALDIIGQSDAESCRILEWLRNSSTRRIARHARHRLTEGRVSRAPGCSAPFCCNADMVPA